MTFKDLRHELRRAMRGAHYDYTQGNIWLAVLLLAIPMMLELSLESVFALVDMYFVAGLGPNAIAIVGLTESVISLVYAASIGLSTGATAIVARRTGEKDADGAAHASAQAILLGLAVAAVMGCIGVLSASHILGWMGASPEVIAEGAVFARYMFVGTPAVILLFLINGIYRGTGDAAMAMKSLWLASGVNIIGCPLLIHFFGLKGAALATIGGRTVGVLYQLYHLRQVSEWLHLRKAHFRPNLPILKSLFSISWPATLQFALGGCSWIVLTRLVAVTGGTAASAGYQIAFRNYLFFILPAWGLSNAAATLVGQNLGAAQPLRAKASVYTTAKLCFLLMAAVSAFFYLGAESIIGVFTGDPDVLRHGVTFLRIIGSGFIFYGVALVLIQALNGAGDTRTPTWLNFVCFWLFQVPLAYALAMGWDFGARGAVTAMPLAEALLAALAWYYFSKDHWQKVRV